MEDYKGSHVLLFDLNDSQDSSSSSSFSVGRASLSSDQEDGNKVKSHMDKSNFWKDQAKEDHPQVDDRDQDEAYKWMPSKMRILRKMMMSSCQESSQKFEDQKQFPSTATINHPNTSRRASYNNDTINDSVRVCADCNTTKTPLWRSGPRGPKSLCNACGIRQRKARRAMAAAAAAASGTILPVSAPPPLKIKLKHKKKRSKGLLLRDDPQLKKTRKASSPKSSPPSKKDELVRFEDFTSRVLSKHYYAKVFPQDEKEAAILLMALSCGIVCN